MDKQAERIEELLLSIDALVLWARKIQANRDPKAREEAKVEWPELERRTFRVIRGAIDALPDSAYDFAPALTHRGE